MLLAIAAAIYEFLCGWCVAYSKAEEPAAPLAELLAANKVITNDTPQMDSFIIHTNTPTHQHQKKKQGAAKRARKGVRARKSTNPGWVTFTHPNRKDATSISSPSKETVAAYLSKGYTMSQ